MWGLRLPESHSLHTWRRADGAFVNRQTGWHPLCAPPPLSAQQEAPHTINFFVPLWCLDGSGFWEQVRDVTLLGVTAWNWSPFGTEPSCCAGALSPRQRALGVIEAVLGSILDKCLFCMLLAGGPWVSCVWPCSLSFLSWKMGDCFRMHRLLPSVPRQSFQKPHSVM